MKITLSKVLLWAMICTGVAVAPVERAAAQDLDRAVGAIIGTIIGGALQQQQRQRQQSQPRRQQAQPARPAISQAQRQATREVQTALNFFEFSAGGVDGVMGPNTRGAIRSFQQTMGFEATGSLTDTERDFLVGSYHRARHAGAIPRDSRILAQDGPQALLATYRTELENSAGSGASVTSTDTVEGAPQRQQASAREPGGYVPPEDALWVQAASRRDLAEARAFARQLGEEARIFRTANGWYAVTATILNFVEQEDALEWLIEHEGLPRDSLLTPGENYVEEIPVQPGAPIVPAFTYTETISTTTVSSRYWRDGAPIYDEIRIAAAGEAVAVWGVPDERGDCLVSSNEGIFMRCADLAAFAGATATTADVGEGAEHGVGRSLTSADAIFGSHAVLEFDSVNHCVQYNEIDRFLGCLSDAGASEAGIAAARALSGEGGSAFLSDYWPLGRVDAVETVSQSASNVHWHGLVIDGNRHMPAGFDHMSARDGASRSLQRRFPNATSMSPTWISGHRYLKDGGQRFILTGVVTDGCRACDVIAVAIGYVDFREGQMVDSGTIGWAQQRGAFPTSTAEIRRRLNARDVREMQTQLNLRGYIAGSMDGAYGPNTAGALREFRREHCLGDNAEWTRETADLLAPRERFDMRLDAAPCGPGPQMPAATAVSAVDLEAFPLREGVYARSVEYCRFEDFDPADYTDGIASVRRLFEDNTMHYYESACHVDGAIERDGRVHVTYTCSGEGDTWSEDAVFENVSETAFTEVSEDDPFLHEAADFVFSEIRGNDGLISLQHCDVLLGETSSTLSEIVADESPQVGTGLTRDNAGADEFNIFTYLMEEFCVGRDCNYFTGRSTSECTPDCAIEGISGSYLARSVSPDQARHLLGKSGEHTMIQTQQGVPYGFEGRLAEGQVDDAQSFGVFRDTCETDQCDSLLVSIISEGEGYIADVPAGADRKEIDSVYSTLDTDNDCSLLDGLPEDDPGHAYFSVMRCQGAERHEVILGDYHLRMQLHYVGSDLTDRYHAQEHRASESFAEFNHVHDVVEWRRREVDGAMEPFATIHRWFVQLEQPGGPREHPMLLVQTVASAPGEESCIVGYVDAHANPNANEIARQVADEVAPRFECGIDEMQSHGETTDRTPHPARIDHDAPDRTSEVTPAGAAQDTEEDLPTEVEDPLPSMRLTAGFFDPAYRASQNRQHLGGDYGAPVGTEVRSPVTGVVVSNNTLDTEDGNLKRVIIRDGATGHEHVLGHIDSDLAEGTAIRQGDVVGSIVAAGTGPHLHWGINRSGIEAAMGHGWGWGRAHASATAAQAAARGWMDPERYRAGSAGAAPAPGDVSADEDAAPPQARDEMVALEDLRLAAGFLDPDYADRHDRQLLGLDLRGDAGTVLRAPISGMIMGNRTGPDVPAAEKWLIIREPATGQEHVFGHVVSTLEPGEAVTEDDPIGEIAEGRRVHWGVNEAGVWQAVDTAEGWGWGHGPAAATEAQVGARGWIDPNAITRQEVSLAMDAEDRAIDELMTSIADVRARAPSHRTFTDFVSDLYTLYSVSKNISNIQDAHALFLSTLTPEIAAQAELVRAQQGATLFLAGHIAKFLVKDIYARADADPDTAPRITRVIPEVVALASLDAAFNLTSAVVTGGASAIIGQTISTTSNIVDAVVAYLELGQQTDALVDTASEETKWALEHYTAGNLSEDIVLSQFQTTQDISDELRSGWLTWAPSADAANRLTIIAGLARIRVLEGEGSPPRSVLGATELRDRIARMNGRHCFTCTAEWNQRYLIFADKIANEFGLNGWEPMASPGLTDAAAGPDAVGPNSRSMEHEGYVSDLTGTYQLQELLVGMPFGDLGFPYCFTFVEPPPMEITGLNIHFYEPTCVFKTPLSPGQTRYDGMINCSSEGQTWEEPVSLILDGTRLVRRSRGEDHIYRKCEPVHPE